MDKPFKIKKLNCGIKVLFVQDNSKDLVYFEFCIKNGKINQSKKETEYAHMLEHMNGCFTSQKYPSAYENVINLSKIGAKSNASVDNYLTRYFIKSKLKDKTYVFDLIMNSYKNFQIDTTYFEQEKQSVIEELQSNQNKQWTTFYNNNAKVLYKYHPNSLTINERIKKTKKIRINDILKYRKKNYTCNNTTIIVGGNLDTKFYMNKLNTMFKSYKTEKYNQKYPKTRIQIKENVYYTKVNSKSNKLLLSFNTGINRFNKTKIMIELVNKLLTGDLNSRLYALRIKYGLIYNINSYEESEIYGSNHANYLIETDLSTKNILIGYQKIIEILKNTKITDNEYKTIRNQILMEKSLHLQETNIEKYINQYIYYVVFNRKVITFANKYKILLSCKKSKIPTLLKSIFKNNKLVVSYGGPKKVKLD